VVGRLLAAAPEAAKAQEVDTMAVVPARPPVPTRIDVGICTFRRPGLADTLRSLAAVTVPDGAKLRLIVADNDVTASAGELVERLAAEIPHEIVYVHAPARNISIARNACLERSIGDYLAFIDDDETASTDWLVKLLDAACATGADAVLGPVHACYRADAPGWMRRGNFHSTFPVWVRGAIRTGYTCNVLLRRNSSAVAGRRFSLALGQSGGEDTAFFSELHQAGGRIAFAPDAWIHEAVPKERARFSWLAKRRFRAGQTHGRLAGEERGGVRLLSQFALAGAKAGYCLVAASGTAFLPERRNRAVLRGIMHAGVMAGLLGLREIRQYGDIGPAGEHGNAA
jgi:succinoglycan biosynthesis protein ExoM